MLDLNVDVMNEIETVEMTGINVSGSEMENFIQMGHIQYQTELKMNPQENYSKNF
jgi:hypothetical protein